jgi:nicotinate-nucleotide adenylyltransferase
MQQNAKRILFFGGSFDPVHIGHLILARDAMETFNYQKVVFIPTYISPFKVKTGHRADAKDRLNMLQLALSGVDYFEIEPYEILKGGVSYTLQTAQYLKQKHNLEKVHWLMGDDTFLKFHKWYSFKELLKILLPVVLLRNSTEREVVNYAKTTLGLSPEGFKIFKSRRLEISSTEIRNRLKEGKDIRFMVPDKVYSYIRERNLYKT